MIYIVGFAAFVLGIIAGFVLACHAASIMQQDFVATFTKPPRGK